MSRGGRTAFAAAAALVAVGAGYAVGQSLSTTGCSSAAGSASLVAVVLGLVSLFRGPSAAGRLAGIGLVGYVVAATVTEQFAWAGGIGAVLTGVLWLVPPVVGGVVLPRRGAWLAGVGCWAVLFAGTAALTHSTTHTGSGVGLIVAWRE